MNLKMTDRQENDIIELRKKIISINEAIKDLYNATYPYNITDYHELCDKIKGDLPIDCTMSIRISSDYEEMFREIFKHLSTYKDIIDDLKIEYKFEPEINQILQDILTYDEYSYLRNKFGLIGGCKEPLKMLLELFDMSEKELMSIRASAYKKIKANKRIKQIIRISNRDISEDLNYELTKSINSMDISERSYNVLRKAGIKYVYDVSKMSISEIRKIKGAGNKVVDEIVQCMINDYGCSLKD